MRYTLTLLLATTLLSTNVYAENIFCSNEKECDIFTQIMYLGVVNGFNKRTKEAGLNVSFPVSYNTFKTYLNDCGKKETTENAATNCLMEKIQSEITRKKPKLEEENNRLKPNTKVTFQTKQKPQQTDKDKIELKQQNEYWKNITPEELNNYLTKNPDINAKDKRSWTPLMWAAKETQNPEIIKILLQKGADVNITDNENWTPFLFAIHKNQNMEIIQLLLDNGANIHQTTNIGLNALHLAAKNNQNPKIVQMLIDKGFNVNKRDKSEFKFTPIMYAIVNNNNPEVIYTLINNNALLHEKDATGNSTLMLAALNNKNIEIIQKLIDEKLVIDQRNDLGMTALHLATRNENPEILEYLLKKGADKTAKVKNLDALGTAALFATQPETIQVLLQNDFDINTKYNIGTFHYLVKLSSLLQGYDEKTTTVKLNPLAFAVAFNKNPEITQEIISSGANVNERLFFGFTPLFFSLINENPEIIKVLLSNEAKTHIRANDKSTPLTFVLDNLDTERDINPEIIELLVTNGVDINAQTSKNETALLIAARKTKNPEIIETLIRLGADIKVRDNNGKMVLDYAKKNPNLKNTKTYQKLKDLYFKK